MAHIILQTDLPDLVLAVFEKPGSGEKETKPEMIEAHSMTFGRADGDSKSRNLQVHFTMKDVANLPVFMKAMHEGTALSIAATVYDSAAFDREILYVSSGAAQVTDLHLSASDDGAHPSFEMTLNFVDFTMTRFVLDHSGQNDKAKNFSYEPAAM
jgi:hypothetical protein